MTLRACCSIASLLLVTCIAAPAQQPTVLHARVSTQEATKELSSQIKDAARKDATVWIGYEIPVAPGSRFGSENGETTFLEEKDDHHYGRYAETDTTCDHVVLLLRTSAGTVTSLRLERPGRRLDAGGLPFLWLTGVSPESSVRQFTVLASSQANEKLRNDAVFFLSLHQSPETIPALTTLASAGQDLKLREQAAFWLANQRGPEAFLALQRLARNDADAAFRENLTFDLTLVHDPAAPEELIRMAHSDPSSQVRRQAQFWMATVGGKKVAGDLQELAKRDPELEVRKSAVFALSRLPGDEATRRLITVAQTSKDPDVRKQAVFWLGQSSDPGALAYLTHLLEQ